MGFTKGDRVVTRDGSGTIVSGPDSDGDYDVDMGLYNPVLYHEDDIQVDEDYYDDDLEVEFEDDDVETEPAKVDQLSLFLQGGSDGPG